MSFSKKALFEDLSSELHISIFEYFNCNELIQSFFNLNQYFNQLLCDYHLLLHCTLIDDRNDIDILLSAICLQQLKSLKCYDYHLMQFNSPEKLSNLRSLVIFKYATNICEEIVIDSILGILQLKLCQIKRSQSHGEVVFVRPHYYQNVERVPSDLEFLDIDSTSGLKFSYFYSDILRYLPYLRHLNACLSYDDVSRKTMGNAVNQLVYLSKLNLKICKTKLEHLELLLKCTPNIEYL